MTSDLLSLPLVTLDHVQAHIRQHWLDGQIYHSMANALLIVNPMRSLAAGNDGSTQHNELRQLVAQAHADAREGSEAVILLQGESGSGKTFTLREIVKEALRVVACAPKIEQGIFQKLDCCSTILELFGNAATPMNSDSSRFGRQIRLHLDPRTHEVAKVSSRGFLLETSRSAKIGTLAPDHSNFHAIICLQSSTGRYPQLHLDMSFRLIPRPTSETDRTKLYDKWTSTMARLESLTGSSTASLATAHVLAGLLHLGQIQGTEATREDDLKSLSLVAQCWGLSQRPLVLMFLHVDPTLGSGYKTAADIHVKRDTAISGIYSALFSYLTDLIMESEEDSTASLDFNEGPAIVMVDTPGWEDFEENSLPQLIFNHFNEVMRRANNHSTMQFFKQDLVIEGLNETEADRCSPPADLGLENTTALMSYINDAAKHRSSTFSNAESQLSGKFATQRGKSSAASSTSTVQIHHSTGLISYQTKNLVSDNACSSLDISTLMTSTITGITNILARFPVPRKANDTVAHLATVDTKRLFKRFTEGGCTPRMVFCLKPNKRQSDGSAWSEALWDQDYVRSQLITMGIINKLELMRGSWPERMLISVFHSNFVKTGSCRHSNQDEARSCVQFYLSDRSDCQLARTKVFLQAGVLASLYQEKEKTMASKVMDPPARPAALERIDASVEPDFDLSIDCDRDASDIEGDLSMAVDWHSTERRDAVIRSPRIGIDEMKALQLEAERWKSDCQLLEERLAASLAENASLQEKHTRSVDTGNLDRANLRRSLSKTVESLKSAEQETSNLFKDNEDLKTKLSDTILRLEQSQQDLKRVTEEKDTIQRELSQTRMSSHLFSVQRKSDVLTLVPMVACPKSVAEDVNVRSVPTILVTLDGVLSSLLSSDPPMIDDILKALQDLADHGTDGHRQRLLVYCLVRDLVTKHKTELAPLALERSALFQKSLWSRYRSSVGQLAIKGMTKLDQQGDLTRLVVRQHLNKVVGKIEDFPLEPSEIENVTGVMMRAVWKAMKEGQIKTLSETDFDAIFAERQWLNYTLSAVKGISLPGSEV